MDQTLKRWLCVLPAMAFPSIAALGYFVLTQKTGTIQLLYGANKCFAIFWPLLASLFILKEPPRLNGRDSRLDFRALPLGAAMGLIVGIGIYLGYRYSPLGPIVDQSAPLVRAKMLQAGIMNQMLPFALVLSVLHSALEEYQWRWFIYGNLKKLLPPFWAHQAGAWSFASHHFIIVFCFFPPWAALLAGLGVVMGGLCWQWMMDRQKSLAGAWLAHALVDGAIFVVAFQILKI